MFKTRRKPCILKIRKPCLIKARKPCILNYTPFDLVSGLIHCIRYNRYSSFLIKMYCSCHICKDVIISCKDIVNFTHMYINSCWLVKTVKIWCQFLLPSSIKFIMSWKFLNWFSDKWQGSVLWGPLYFLNIICFDFRKFL